MLTGFIRDNQDGSPLGRMSGILTTFANEMAEEMHDMDEIKTRIFMAQTGAIISWIGHGDNDQLPDAIRAFAEQIQPSEQTAEDEPSSLAELDAPIG